MEWLITETATSPISWKSKSDEGWDGTFTVEDIPFQIDIWYDWQKIWMAQFNQLNGDNSFRFDDIQPLNFSQLVGLFKVVDDGLVQFFQANPNANQIRIHPETVGAKRDNLVQKRNIPRKTATFDPSKFNAYQQLFQYSKLKGMGFNMRTEGEYLHLERPAS